MPKKPALMWSKLFKPCAEVQQGRKGDQAVPIIHVLENELITSLELYAERILQRDFEPGFFVDHFVKDLGICVNECERMGKTSTKP